MKNLKVNDNCIGCGACIAVDPEHFDFNDEGLSHAISNENLETDELKNAVSSCPVGAIQLTECNCGDECQCGNDCKCGDECQCGDDCKCGDECQCGDDCKCGENCNCHKEE